MICGTLRQLLAGAKAAFVVCVYTGKVVRRLTAIEDTVAVNMMGEDQTIIQVPLDAAMHFEAWIMDRGSITWLDPFHGTLKLCTEHDWLELPDGTRRAIESAW